MRHGLFCLLLLLPACSFFSPPDGPESYEYVLTWYCISPEGCEHAGEAARIDRATSRAYEFSFTSTQDASFNVEADRLFSESLPAGCSWIYYLSFFGHELERSMLCTSAAGFELEALDPQRGSRDAKPVGGVWPGCEVPVTPRSRPAARSRQAPAWPGARGLSALRRRTSSRG